MLALEKVSVAFGTTQALREVSVHVGEGEVVCLLGANGAGKSTTLRSVSGLVPYSGSISFSGEDVAGQPPDLLARKGLGHVLEGRRIFGTLSVHENLLVGQAASVGRGAAFSSDDIYDLFPTLARMRTRAGWALSGGEQQMLAVGRALVGAPRMLLLDEPSLGLAPVVVSELFQVLSEVKSRVPMLLVEQNTAMAMRVAERAYVLAQGQVVLSGSAGDLTDRSALLRSYLGQEDLPAGDADTPATADLEETR
jgi:branched-chain amino acid transport system ATP-binding protein